jgi:hypothetical protein
MWAPHLPLFDVSKNCLQQSKLPRCCVESGLNVTSSDFSDGHHHCVSCLPSPQDSPHLAVSAPHLGHPTSSTVRHGRRHLCGHPPLSGLRHILPMNVQSRSSTPSRPLFFSKGAVLSLLWSPTFLANKAASSSNASTWVPTPPWPHPYWGCHRLSPQVSHSQAVNSTSQASLVTLPGLGSLYLSTVLYIPELFGMQR